MRKFRFLLCLCTILMISACGGIPQVPPPSTAEYQIYELKKIIPNEEILFQNVSLVNTKQNRFTVRDSLGQYFANVVVTEEHVYLTFWDGLVGKFMIRETINRSDIESVQINTQGLDGAVMNLKNGQKMILSAALNRPGKDAAQIPDIYLKLAK